MRWIKQRTHTDCGIAVVAMVADVSYDEAKAAFGQFKGRGYETDAGDLRRALKNLGVRLGKRLWPLRGASQIDLDFDAIALVRLDSRTGKPEDHWVVWDGFDHQIRDPMRRRANATYRFLGYFKVKRRSGAPCVARTKGADVGPD